MGQRALPDRWRGRLARRCYPSPGENLKEDKIFLAAAWPKLFGHRRRNYNGPGESCTLGVFGLEIPDEPHILGEPYENDTIYAKTWFRIGHTGDRYLHLGRISKDCFTVAEVAKWTDIYNYLIKRRKGDDKSVGTVEVVETKTLETEPLIIRLKPAIEMTEEQFNAFRQINPELSIEQTSEGELLIQKLIRSEQEKHK